MSSKLKICFFTDDLVQFLPTNLNPWKERCHYSPICGICNAVRRVLNIRFRGVNG